MSAPDDSASRTSGNPKSDELLSKIASAVGRESLESLLRRLNGARLQDDKVILEVGTANSFFSNQVRENLPAITKAAADVVGRRVAVLLEELQPDAPENTAESPNTADNREETEILKKAKREPIVQSFLDVFPGQVKAEKIDS